MLRSPSDDVSTFRGESVRVPIRYGAKQAMANRIDKFTQRSSVETVQNLLKEWDVTSPPVLKVARALNDLLELWANTFIDSVGLVSDTS